MKKAQIQIGVGMIVLAIVLLLGGMIFSPHDNTSQKDRYTDNRNKVDTGYPHEDYLFYLNQTDLGRQKKVTQSFPNINLGSATEFNTIFVGNNFRLNANPFTSNTYSFDVDLPNTNHTQSLLLYFSPSRVSGNQEVIITVDNREISRNLLRSHDVPIRIPRNYLTSNSKATVTFQLVKPSFIDLFNWNALDISELRVVEERRDSTNNQREFDFHIDQRFLNGAGIDLTVSCDEVGQIGNAIKVTINGYIIMNSNPDCSIRNNRLSANIPLNILRQGANRLVLETSGNYRVAYGITNTYYNDQFVYKFNVNSFNDLIDVVMYGDFDREVIDVRINSQLMSLRRDQIRSIIPYLRFGTNEIEFVTKPVEIREFVIERNQFMY